MYKPNSLWTWLFVAVTSIQAAIVLGFESWVSQSMGRHISQLLPEQCFLHWWRILPHYDKLTSLFSFVFATFQQHLKENATGQTASKTIPTFLTLYIFGFLYQLVLVYDALRLKNTIQIIGLCIYNVGLLVYAAVQWIQIQDAVQELEVINPSFIDDAVLSTMKPYLTALPCIIALGTVLMSVVAWKLYDEFAWTIYKHISADLRMKRRYLTFQVLLAHVDGEDRSY